MQKYPIYTNRQKVPTTDHLAPRCKRSRRDDFSPSTNALADHTSTRRDDPHRGIREFLGANLSFPPTNEKSLRKNQLKLRKNEIEVPKNFSSPPWSIVILPMGTFRVLTGDRDNQQQSRRKLNYTNCQEDGWILHIFAIVSPSRYALGGSLPKSTTRLQTT